MISRQHRINRAAADQVIQISPRTLPQAESGTYYSYQLETVGLLPGETVTWTIVSGALPDGLTMDVDGFISGIPTALGVGTAQFVAETDHGF